METNTMEFRLTLTRHETAKALGVTPITIDRLVARGLASQGKYAEAQPLLQWAVKSFPTEELLWQNLAYCTSQQGCHQEATGFCREDCLRG